LEKHIIEEMTRASAAVMDFMGYSLHDMNAVQLKAVCERASIAGFDDNLHMMGELGYATLFYNFDASMMEKHTEFDMNMTTIFVPKQEWKNKMKNHLQFCFSFDRRREWYCINCNVSWSYFILSWISSYSSTIA